MVAITNILLVAVTASASIIARDFATVQADLKTINTDTQKLTKDVKAWDGSLSGVIPIQNDFTAVLNDINKATNDTKASPVATSSQATTLINYINNTLEPSTSGSINATISRKPAFTKNGLGGTVCNNLQTLKANETSLGAALLAKTPQAQKSAATAAQNKVLADINRGIAAFC